MTKYLIVYDGKIDSEFILSETEAKAKFNLEIKENKEFPIYYSIELLKVEEVEKEDFTEE